MDNKEACEVGAATESAIPSAMSKLDRAIVENSEVVGELLARIGPVLMPETPTPKGDPKKEDLPQRCDLEARLFSATARVIQVTMQTRLALDRLQL